MLGGGSETGNCLMVTEFQFCKMRGSGDDGGDGCLIPLSVGALSITDMYT